MGNCLPAKEQNSGIDSMRLSQSTPGEDGEEEEEEGYGDTELKMSATSEKKFSSNMNDLFGDMMADMKSTLKEETILKLGGKKKDKWEARKIELTSVGIQWKKEGAITKLGGKDVSEVGVAEILNVRISDFDENVASTMYPVAFEIATSVKNGKTYKFRTMSQEMADDWVTAIAKLVADNGQTMEKIGEETESEPAPPSAEELAAAAAAEEEAQRKKEEERAARKERMAQKRKAAVEAQKKMAAEEEEEQNV